MIPKIIIIGKEKEENCSERGVIKNVGNKK
jgi:hypothetical protein